MKTSTPIVAGASVPISEGTRTVARSNRALDFLALTKPRLNLLGTGHHARRSVPRVTGRCCACARVSHTRRDGARCRRSCSVEPGMGTRDGPANAAHQQQTSAARSPRRDRGNLVWSGALDRGTR